MMENLRSEEENIGKDIQNIFILKKKKKIILPLKIQEMHLDQKRN